MDKTRKPNTKDKVFGCISFAKDLIIGVFLLDIHRIRFDWFMICETIKGNYRVVVKDK